MNVSTYNIISSMTDMSEKWFKTKLNDSNQTILNAYFSGFNKTHNEVDI